MKEFAIWFVISSCVFLGISNAQQNGQIKQLEQRLKVIELKLNKV